MNKKIACLILLVFCGVNLSAQTLKAPFELSNGNESPEYKDVIAFYTSLSKIYPEIKITDIGPTNSAEMLKLVSITKGNPDGKLSILINNGIHPGEPDGIDASMILVKMILEAEHGVFNNNIRYFRNKLSAKNLKGILDVANIFIIPVYNIDGALNRNSHSRTNQNGPEAYGFRANGKNLDLNRDFIKMDSENAKSFAKAFHQTRPHLFIDTHTSNGADYQHTLTYIATQRNKLQKTIADYLYDVYMPEFNSKLIKDKWNPVPYVNAWSQVPDSGWAAFYESPRYATGYTTLFNTMGFTIETHMLKNYSSRVEATFSFLYHALIISAKEKNTIINNRNIADKEALNQNRFALNWKLDSTAYQMIDFHGYQSGYKKSEVSGMDRLYYDRSKPFVKKVKYYHQYKTTTEVSKPKAYIISSAWTEVIRNLSLNKIELKQFQSDTILRVKCYYIEDYKTAAKPYEGHYAHSQVKLREEATEVKVLKGDYIIYTDQPSVRFIIETLEPQAVDSYFNWNFFDAILSQKEYFSDYVFEDTAAELLKKNPELKTSLENKKSSDAAFAENKNSQLDFIYRNSPYFEKSYLRYPVYRLE